MMIIKPLVLRTFILMMQIFELTILFLVIQILLSDIATDDGGVVHILI